MRSPRTLTLVRVGFHAVLGAAIAYLISTLAALQDRSFEDLNIDAWGLLNTAEVFGSFESCSTATGRIIFWNAPFRVRAPSDDWDQVTEDLRFATLSAWDERELGLEGPIRPVPRWSVAPAGHARLALKDSFAAGGVVEKGSGWPWTVARCRWQWVKSGQSFDAQDFIWLEGGVVSPWPRTSGPTWQRAVVPLEPWWPGLLSAVAMWGAVTWALHTLVIQRRALRRFRRGHCPRCRYDRGHRYDTPCPECGER